MGYKEEEKEEIQPRHFSIYQFITTRSKTVATTVRTTTILMTSNGVLVNHRVQTNMASIYRTRG